MEEFEARKRQSESTRLATRSDAGLRQSSYTPKVSREYAEYFNEIHSKLLKHDLLKLSQIIEAFTESLKCHDHNNIEPTEIQQTLKRAHLNWVKNLQAYEEYSRLINDSSELDRLSIQRRTLKRNLNDCNQLAIDQLDKSIPSLQRGSIPIDGHHFNDDESRCQRIVAFPCQDPQRVDAR